MPIYMSCLDILITMHFSINCSTVICLPTVILMLYWEKPLVKPMAPRSTFHYISFQSILLCNLYFPIYIIKIPKKIILLSLSDLTLVSDCEGIDNPFIALVARFLFVCVGARWLACSLLLDWYLGSQKTKGNTYTTLLHHPFLFKAKPTQCSRGSKKDFWHRCRGVYAKVNISSTHHKPLSPALHYLPFASRFPLPSLHPCRFIRPLSLHPPSLSLFTPFCPFLVCLCAGLLACPDGSR